MTRKHHFKRWVSQLLLAMPLAVIGILAACNTSPTRSKPYTLTNLAVTAKQAEAKSTLQQIYLAEQAHHRGNGFYWITASGASARNHPRGFETLGIIILPEARYTYYISGSNNSFVATAVSSYLDDDVTQDIWTITDEGRLACVLNDAVH